METEMIHRLNLELAKEAIVLFQELKNKYNVTAEALMKVAFTMLYEAVCIYPADQGWRISFYNENFPDRSILVDLLSPIEKKPNQAMFEGMLNQKEVILIDPQTAVCIQDLMITYCDNQNLMIQQALTLFIMASFQYSHKEDWVLVAVHKDHSMRTLESFDALIAIDS